MQRACRNPARTSNHSGSCLSDKQVKSGRKPFAKNAVGLSSCDMNLRSSRILRELRAGKRPTCLKMNLGDPRVIELCGLAGASSVWICNEHVSNDWFNMENQIRAAKLYDVDTIVRVEKGSYSDYVKPFESDATAIMVPHVRTAEEAKQIVQMTRFHPLGRRAVDGGNPDGRYCQIPVAEYMAHSNSERLLIFQIECPLALENV